MTVPTYPQTVPTVPTSGDAGGNAQPKQFRAFQPTVPTVPTYLVYIYKHVRHGQTPLPLEVLGEIGGNVGTAPLKPAQISQKNRSHLGRNSASLRWER